MPLLVEGNWRVGLVFFPLSLLAALLCLLRTPPASAQAVGPEFLVNTYTSYAQLNPRVATSSGGNFVAVWQSNTHTEDGSGAGVFGQRYDSAGAPLGTEFRVNGYTTDAQGVPSVASDSGGGFVVVWQSNLQDGSGYGVFGQRYAKDGLLGAEFRVNTYTTSHQALPSAASDSGGNFVVVWYSDDGLLSGVFGQRYSNTGAPLGMEFRVNTYTTSGQAYPSVASDSGGNFVVVWQSNTQDGAFYGVFGQRYGSSGAPLGAEFRVNSHTALQQNLPSVASDSAGDFVVVWQGISQDGSVYGVFGQRYGSAGAPSGGEFQLNSYTSGDQRFPSVSSDSGGNFVVAWNSAAQDGSGYGVFGQRYGSTGAPFGAEFRVNTFTSANQRRPSVASGSGGKFVAVWISGGGSGATQDGSFDGVMGQRFCPALSSVTISVNGTTTVCPTATGGTATVTDADGGVPSHEWAYRLVSMGPLYPISGQTGATYTINGASFPGVGIYFLVCLTNPECGTFLISNEIPVTVESDLIDPVVKPPATLATTQTLCM